MTSLLFWRTWSSRSTPPRKCCHGNSKGSTLKLLPFNKFLYIFRKRHQIWLNYLSPSLSYGQKTSRVVPNTPSGRIIYTILQNKRMRRCGVPPPPIIFERLKLSQQIIYRRKENLSESPNHKKYWENILVSRFYEQFSRNRRNLGHFRKFEKISNS